MSWSLGACSSSLSVRLRKSLGKESQDDSEESGSGTDDGDDGDEPLAMRVVRKAIQLPDSYGHHPDAHSAAFDRFVGAPSVCDSALKRIPAHSSAFTVCCRRGHTMHGKVAREMLHGMPLGGDRAPICDACRAPIDAATRASYRCKVCEVTSCLRCALTDVSGISDTIQCIMAGDIFLYGPDKWSIHHTVLARSSMKRVTDAVLLETLEAPSGAEVFECYTIESTRGSNGGKVTMWYPALSFFQLIDGVLQVFADMPLDSSHSIELFEEPVSTKVLLHPLRGDRLDQRVFNEAVIRGAAEAKRYGRRSAIKAFFAQALTGGSPSVMEFDDFGTPESRAKLLDDLRQRWDRKPICAALCVKVWQVYFEMLGSEAGELDEGVKEILRWMPVYSNTVTPSALVKALTLHGWQVRQL